MVNVLCVAHCTRYQNTFSLTASHLTHVAVYTPLSADQIRIPVLLRYRKDAIFYLAVESFDLSFAQLLSPTRSTLDLGAGGSSAHVA